MLLKKTLMNIIESSAESINLSLFFLSLFVSLLETREGSKREGIKRLDQKPEFLLNDAGIRVRLVGGGGGLWVGRGPSSIIMHI